MDFKSGKHTATVYLRQIAFVAISLFCIGTGKSVQADSEPDHAVQQYSYKLHASYPHDSNAFTQGLVYDNGVLYESTGRYGQSSLRIVDLTTGASLRTIALPDTIFAEGLTVVDDTLVQLSYRAKKGFVYSKHDLRQLKTFSYPTEGWGVTYNGHELILSDGSERLYFLDTDNFQIQRALTVRLHGKPLKRLNELEYVAGAVFANVWHRNFIVQIDPVTGQVIGQLDLSPLAARYPAAPAAAVLNGIAYNPATQRFYVTGKLWPELFEIELLSENTNPDDAAKTPKKTLK